MACVSLTFTFLVICLMLRTIQSLSAASARLSAMNKDTLLTSNISIHTHTLLAHGDCLILQHPDPPSLAQSALSSPDHPLHKLLHPDELYYCSQSFPTPSSQSGSFLLGRVALRLSLAPHADDHAMLKTSTGRPTPPPAPFQGSFSLSHKDNLIATLAHPDPTAVVGVDIERCPLPTASKLKLQKRVLTPTERADLDATSAGLNLTPTQQTLLRFSLKESLYKSIHPLLDAYVGFQEVSITPHSSGTASVEWNLTGDAKSTFHKLDGATIELAHQTITSDDGASYFLTSCCTSFHK